MLSLPGVAIVLGALAGCACTKSSKSDTGNPSPDKEAPVPEMDPNSPQSWKDAEAIAAKVAAGKLEKRSDALPFMFTADKPPAVLVHKGRVVTEKGPAAAGSYLRDLGITDGKGPGIDDVLFVLDVFEAWPPIDGVPKRAYVKAGDPSLDEAPEIEKGSGLVFVKSEDFSPEEFPPRIERETDRVEIVLHYFRPGFKRLGVETERPDGPSPEYDDVEGAPYEGDDAPEEVVLRQVIRATFAIPKTGQPAWKPVQEVNWEVGKVMRTGGR